MQDAYSKYTTVKGIQDLPETDVTMPRQPDASAPSRSLASACAIAMRCIERRVVLEPEVVPERRARLLEARLLEAAGRARVADAGRASRSARASRPPPRSGVRRRSGSAPSAARAPSARAPRTAGSPARRRPPRRRVASASSQSVGSTISALQPIAFTMCRLRTCPSSCAITTSCSPREKRPSRSVSQRTTCVDGPNPTVNAFAWSVHDETSWTPHRRALHVLDPLEPRDVRARAPDRAADACRRRRASPRRTRRAPRCTTIDRRRRSATSAGSARRARRASTIVAIARPPPAPSTAHCASSQREHVERARAPSGAATRARRARTAARRTRACTSSTIPTITALPIRPSPIAADRSAAARRTRTTSAASVATRAARARAPARRARSCAPARARAPRSTGAASRPAEVQRSGRSCATSSHAHAAPRNGRDG